MKAAFFDLDDRGTQKVNQQCKKAKIDVVKVSSSSLDLIGASQAKEAEILSVFLSQVDQSIIEALPSLKLISTRATGSDHIDIDYAKKKGIAVINVPAYASDTVAQYAMTLILMLARELSVTLEQTLSGTFDQKSVRGHDVAGKTLGLIGTGKIGCKLAKMAYGFDMNIACFDVTPNQELCMTCKADYMSKEALLENSDIISIHLPYTKDTHHFIDFDALKYLKKGVLLVNTARGPIVDTAAVHQGLKDQIFGGVALDTFEGEKILIKKKELPKDFKEAPEVLQLLKFKNVILTPHNAFNSYEAAERMMETALSDIIAFSEKGDCSHRIV